MAAIRDRVEDHGRQAGVVYTQTIVNQVEAMKNMVNDFRDYARTPLPQLAAVDIDSREDSKGRP